MRRGRPPRGPWWRSERRPIPWGVYAGAQAAVAVQDDAGSNIDDQFHVPFN
jgi:hypothetical protein